MRNIRSQPFSWQEKNILRAIRSKYKENKAMLRKMKLLYFTLTEMDSDFNGQDIQYYTKTISTYSGLNIDWIPVGLKEMENMKIISIIEERENGRFKGKYLIFHGSETESSENVQKHQSTNAVKTGNGKTGNGKTGTSEHISSLEDSKEEKGVPSSDLRSPDPDIRSRIRDLVEPIHDYPDLFLKDADLALKDLLPENDEETILGALQTFISQQPASKLRFFWNDFKRWKSKWDDRPKPHPEKECPNCGRTSQGSSSLCLKCHADMDEDPYSKDATYRCICGKNLEGEFLSDQKICFQCQTPIPKDVRDRYEEDKQSNIRNFHEKVERLMKPKVGDLKGVAV